MKILLEEAMSEKKIQVTLGNYKGVEVKKAEIIITEEEVKAELERARQYAVTTQDKDGAAELGDEAVIDFVGYIDGEAFAGGDGTDFPLKLGSNTFIPGFEDQLVGAKKERRCGCYIPGRLSCSRVCRKRSYIQSYGKRCPQQFPSGTFR